MAVGDYVQYFVNAAGVYSYFQPAAGVVLMVLSFGGSNNAGIGLHDTVLGADDSCLGTGVFNGLMSAFGVESSVVNTKIIVTNTVYLNSYSTTGASLCHACMVQVQ